MFEETRDTRFAEMRKFPPSLEAWRDPIEKTINKKRREILGSRK